MQVNSVMVGTKMSINRHTQWSINMVNGCYDVKSINVGQQTQDSLAFLMSQHSAIYIVEHQVHVLLCVCNISSIYYKIYTRGSD